MLPFPIESNNCKTYTIWNRSNEGLCFRLFPTAENCFGIKVQFRLYDCPMIKTYNFTTATVEFM